MNLFTPERLETETLAQYRNRQQEAKRAAKEIRKGVMPTLFYQWRPNQIKKEQASKEAQNGNA